MPSRRSRRPHNRPLTANKLGLPPEAHKRYREEQEKQRAAVRQRLVRMPVGMNVCLECDGTGKVTGPLGPSDCPVCHGRGTTQVWPPKIKDALKARVAAQEGARQTMNAVVQAIASDPVKMMASMPTFMGQLPTTHPAKITRPTARARPGVPLVFWEDMIQGKKPTEIKPDGTERFLIMPNEYANHDILLPNDQLVFKGDSKMLILEVSPKGKWPATAAVKEPKETPKREGTWWELPEEEKPSIPEPSKPAQIALDHLREEHRYHPFGTILNPVAIQPLMIQSGTMVLDELEIEADPLNPTRPMVADCIDVEDIQTGYRSRVSITNIVSTNGGQTLHLRVTPPLTGFDVNHLRVELVGPRFRPLHLSPSFKVEKAKEQVERAFREHMSQYLGSPTSATTIRDVKLLAEQVIARFKASTILPDHEVDVTTDPLNPGQINVTVKWKDPTLINILAKELDEKLPAGVVANLNLEEPEEEPKEAKQPIGREQSFWKLPKS